MKDLILTAGFRSGRLVVREPIKGGKFWLCDCDCGKKTKASKWHLLKQIRRSCGCRLKEQPDELYCPDCDTIKPIADFYIRKPRPGHGKQLYQRVCKKCVGQRVKRWQRKIRIKVLEYYSSGTPHCACCGITQFEFLAIDHIDGGGNAHKKRENINSLYKWLWKNKLPAGFRVLCNNCNFALGAYGYCPHQDKRQDEERVQDFLMLKSDEQPEHRR